MGLHTDLSLADPPMHDDLFWDQLLLLIEEGRVVPVVGPELLVVEGDSGPTPYGLLLAEALAEVLHVPTDDLPTGAELEAVTDRYLARPDSKRPRIYAGLKTVVGKLPRPAPPAALQQLAEISDFSLFLSTTPDSLLVEALDLARFDGKARTEVLSYAPDERQDLPRGSAQSSYPCVYHLFGRLSARPSYVVTQEDRLEFLHALQAEVGQPVRLFERLSQATLLVLGSNFGGWLARFFLRSARRERLLNPRDTTDYVVDTVLREDPGLVFFLRHMAQGIEVFDDLSASEFVAELHRRWSERRSAAEPGTATMSPVSTPVSSQPDAGRVFISYASDDGAAAARLKDALDTQVDVFFDKEGLHAGDADWEAKLVRIISKCALFVPVLSRNTVDAGRRHFKMEWHFAIKESQKAGTDAFIVPVVIDDTSIEHGDFPDAFRVPQVTVAPDGHPDPDFVDRIASLYRDFQRTS